MILPVLQQNVFSWRNFNEQFICCKFHIVAEDQSGAAFDIPVEGKNALVVWGCLFLLCLCWWHPGTNLYWYTFAFNNSRFCILIYLKVKKFFARTLRVFQVAGVSLESCVELWFFGSNCLERLFPTPLFAACHLLQGLFLFSAVKHSQFGPCSSGCWEEELLPSCCRGEFPATLKCPRKGWKQNEAWQQTVPGRIMFSELCSAQVRISVSSGLSYMAEEVGPECVSEADLEFLRAPSLPQFWPNKKCDRETRSWGLD